MREATRFALGALLVFAVVAALVVWPIWVLVGIGVLVLVVGIYDMSQKKLAILRNFPVVGHIRYLFQMIAPEIHQYFIESDTDGKPIDRNHRQYIYERAENKSDTHPFGTELDVTKENYMFMRHTIYPAESLDAPPRVRFGGAECKQPYSASILNISAMSYGALSKNAVMALNKGAKAGGFLHDTGEGGISEYHLQGGDLLWELGTAYFGCRTEDGKFDPDQFKEKANWETVKMIAIKISQGAKPGHGGVLPASKNDEEIAKIRGVEPHIDVVSPPGHSAFHDAEGLLRFVAELRRLSNGKPVGFKLCIGSEEEFSELCKKMVQTGILPDFITIDGAEGGTGAASIDLTNYVGMPWEKGLIFAVDTLRGYGLKENIRVMTATKIITAFDIFKALCIGADVCNSARAMMMALGCIQALECDKNTCPTGVTTQNPRLVRGLVVEDKWKHVRNYQQSTLRSFLQLFVAAGCTRLDQLSRKLIYKNVDDEVLSFEERYPSVEPGSYLR